MRKARIQSKESSHRNVFHSTKCVCTQSGYGQVPWCTYHQAKGIHCVAMHFPAHDDPLTHLGLCFLCHPHCPHTPKDKHVRKACRSRTSVMDGGVFLGFPSWQAWKFWVQTTCRAQLIPYNLEDSVIWSCLNPLFSRLKSYLKYFYLDYDYFSLFSRNLASPFLV